MHSFPHPLPTRNSELGTLHSFPHSALSTLHSALFPPLSVDIAKSLGAICGSRLLQSAEFLGN
uniref:Uncharacterized protein n=1 Tax=Desertifilum tharense IPPAS B-1220 TaxID=1781255 RepID=A0ACD5GV30_9CYAN